MRLNQDPAICPGSGGIGVWTPESIKTYGHLGELPASIGDYQCGGCAKTGTGLDMVTQRGLVRQHRPVTAN